MKPLSFVLPHDLNTNRLNWEAFIQASGSGSHPLVLTVAAGSMTISNNWFAVLGPLVFFGITFNVPNGSGWTKASFTNVPMPFLEAQRQSSLDGADMGMFSYNFPVILSTTGEQLDHCWLESPAIGGAQQTLLRFFTDYTNSTGFTQIVDVTGWYFRN